MIILHNFPFSITWRHAGDLLTEAEAETLNGLRREDGSLPPAPEDDITLEARELLEKRGLPADALTSLRPLAARSLAMKRQLGTAFIQSLASATA